jgi:REP element-mobilizing transposase RayT
VALTPAQGWRAAPTLGNLPRSSTLKGLNRVSIPSILIAMAQSLAKILVHTIFSTKNRHPFLGDADMREELHRYLGGILTRLDCQPIVIGGPDDHVHLLSHLSRTCEPAAMVKELKRGSTIWLKNESPKFRDFAWQNGHGIFSVDPAQIEPARKYILEQQEHHRKISFQDELRQLLQRHEITFDERYVWD